MGGYTCPECMARLDSGEMCDCKPHRENGKIKASKPIQREKIGDVVFYQQDGMMFAKVR